MYLGLCISFSQGCVCDVKYYEFPNGVSGDVGDYEGFDCSKRELLGDSVNGEAIASIFVLKAVGLLIDNLAT